MQAAGIILIIICLLLVALMVNTTGWHKIQEDSPHWNCETMGNRVCGE